MKYILDTDTFSFLARKVPSVVDRALEVGFENLFLSTISELEVRTGLAIRKDAKLFLSVSGVLGQLGILDFDSKAAIEAAKVRVFLRSLGKPNGTLDPLLAGHAIALDAVLVTNNTRHFENVPGLLLDNWVNPAA